MSKPNCATISSDATDWGHFALHINLGAVGRYYDFATAVAKIAADVAASVEAHASGSQSAVRLTGGVCFEEMLMREVQETAASRLSATAQGRCHSIPPQSPSLPAAEAGSS